MLNSNASNPEDNPQPSSGTISTNSYKVTTEKPTIEKDRIRYAYHLGLGGIIVIVALAILTMVLSMYGFKDAQAVSSIISPFLTVLGTMVGAFFGLQIGSQGTEQANQQTKEANTRADNAQNMATALAAAADPTKAKEVLNLFNDLSKGK